MSRLRGRRPEPLQSNALNPEEPVDLPPNHRFLMMVHPRHWTIIDGQIVPYVKHFSLEPGVRGVEPNGQATEALARQTAKGWIPIPENARDPDDPEETYLTVYDGKYGPVWCTEWQILYPGSSTVDCDEAGYTAFLRDLMARGVLPSPAPHILREWRARLQKRHLDMLDLAERIPSARPKAGRIQEQIAVIAKELEAAEKREAKNKAPAKSSRARGRRPADDSEAED